MNRHPLTPPGSFAPDDVALYLKDVTGKVEERDAALREREIQSGRHYSEDLPIEFVPSAAYMAVFEALLEAQADAVARYTGVLMRRILERTEKPVLISLVRAGVPCGALLRRYAARELGRDAPHCAISIIRGKGFDENALADVLAAYPEHTPVFVDGWTGKGMITAELRQSCDAFFARHGVRVQPVLAVLADPAYSTDLYATREDFINPSCCLNSTICGLISRSVHNKALIGPEDYHGVRIYREFAAIDQTARYLDTVSDRFAPLKSQIEAHLAGLPRQEAPPDWRGMETVRRIGAAFGVRDINRIKPSIGETTRVLLRRVPDRVLVRDKDHPDLRHIRLLAEEKGVPLTVYPDMPYLCCGLIADRREGAL